MLNLIYEKSGLKKIFGAFLFSLAGIRACMRTERAFRQEICLSVFMVPLGLYIGETHVERILLVGSVLMVLIFELINTSIERAVDRISSERHELSKEAKDMGSAAVFFSLVLAGLTWLAILFF